MLRSTSSPRGLRSFTQRLLDSLLRGRRRRTARSDARAPGHRTLDMARGVEHVEDRTLLASVVTFSNMASTGLNSFPADSGVIGWEDYNSVNDADIPLTELSFWAEVPVAGNFQFDFFAITDTARATPVATMTAPLTATDPGFVFIKTVPVSPVITIPDNGILQITALGAATGAWLGNNTADPTIGTESDDETTGDIEFAGLTHTLELMATGTEDYGDAPTAAQSGFAASYPTLLADSGARHTTSFGFNLGTAFDADFDGLPTLPADGDELDDVADEDGVVLPDNLQRGDGSASVDVTVTNSAGVSTPHLDAWIDFNRDGDWDDTGEHIISDAVTAGSTTHTFAVPADASPGITYARFRLYDGTIALAPTGAAASGEVEDYLVNIATAGNWVAQGPSPIENGQIENVSPNNEISGAIHTVLAHPTDPDILYAGAVNGGVWKTINATATTPTWTPLTDFNTSLSIGALQFDPTDGTNNTIVAGIGRFSSFSREGGSRAGILRSTDGGATWTEFPVVGVANGALNISGVAARGNTIVVSANTRDGSFVNDHGIYRSTDSGQTWTNISNGAGTGLPLGRAFDLVGDPSNNAILYTGITDSNRFGGQNGVYKSTDTGATWTKVSNTAMDNLTYDTPGAGLVTGATNASPIVITSNAHGQLTGDEVTVSGVVGNTAANGTFTITKIDNNSFSLDGSTGNGTYVSGGQWFNTKPIETNNLELAVGSSNNVFAAIVNNARMEGLFRSSDGGATWTQMENPTTLEAPVSLTNASNATPIVITSNNHGLNTGNEVRIAGVTGNTAANGDFTVTKISSNTFSLDGSAGNGAYGGGGTWEQIAGLQPRSKTGGQGTIHFSILADPNDANIVYIGGDRQSRPFPNSLGAQNFTGRLFRGDASQPGTGVAITVGGTGSQWTSLTHSGTVSNSAPHADSREMVFDGNGNIVEVDDGGIYRRTNPTNSTGDWFSVNGNLQVTEIHDIVYDTLSNVIISGNQDNGTSYQPTAGATVWDRFPGTSGDGGDVAVDTITLAGSSQSIRYASSQNLLSFRRAIFDASGAQVGGTATPALTVIGGGAAFEGQFVTPLELNAINPERLVLGGANSVYESSNQGDSITEIGPGIVANANAIAYGGRIGVTDNADVLYVGSGSSVFTRTTSGGSLTATTALPTGISDVLDVVLDPDDWMSAFVIDIDQVFQTTNAGTSWTDITGDLALFGVDNFRTVEFIAGAVDALVLGTGTGVFTSVISTLGTWFEFGTNLPHAPVWDLDYDAADDILVAGTLGRGAWTVPGASTYLPGAPPATSEDWGDAPSSGQSGFVGSYPVTLAEDGARHGDSGATLGPELDFEADGVHSANADADDNTDTGSADDEDGVVFTTSIIASTKTTRTGSVNVDLQDPHASSNKLDAWIDFNRDGDWDDAGEQILASYDLGLTAGVQPVSFTIPQDTGSNVQEGTTYARFRLSAAGGLAVTGAVGDGEVEDHQVTIGASTDAILLEPFDHSGQFTTSHVFFSQGDGSSFFGISDGAGGGDFGTAPPPVPTVKAYTGTTGNFLTGMDMDASPESATLPITTTWTGLDISGESGLQFSADFAALDEGAGGDPGANMEPSDFLRVEVQIDGGGFVNIMEFRGNNTGGINAARLSLDTDGDGSGDGTLLTEALRNFTADIAGTGSLLDVRISLSVSDQDEDFAIDNVSVTSGNASGPYIVDSAADESDGDFSAGDFTLREAIERANTHVGADEIQFAAGLSGSTITLTIDQLTASDDLTITGLGSSNLTVSGGNSFRVFDLQHAKDYEIDGLTITNGRTTTAGQGGGGIRSTGTLLLTNSVVTNNSTAGDVANGGGIYQLNGALDIQNSTISANSTTGVNSYGGGIAAQESTVGAGTDLEITASTIDGNSTASANGLAAGILVISGDLTVTASTISNNVNTGADSQGGGITVATGNLTVTNSTINDNTTTLNGGGILFGSATHTASVTNSTISGNTATTGDGGGISVFQGTFNLSHSTVTGNTAPAGQGSGLASASDGGSSVANTTVLSSIIADNVNSDVDNILSGSGSNTITSADFNLVGSGNAAGEFNQGSDQTGVSAGLGALANNGGPTFTHALLVGSLAIGTGDTASAQATDQRGAGFARVVGGNVDVGAFELEATNPSVTLSVDNANIPEAAGVATFTATLSEISGEDVTVDLGFTGSASGSGTDYNASGTQIVIAAGSLSGFVTVTAVPDVEDGEDNETVIVDITNVTNGTEPSPQQQTTTIDDDEADFGDAPTATQAGGGTFIADYPVTLAENGARHLTTGLTLGTNSDAEADGAHSAAADADDNTGVPDDEDGVTFGAIQVGALAAAATVNVQGAAGKLDAWIDFNQDGIWAPGEQIFDNINVSTGNNPLSFVVPGAALTGTTYARFRLSTAGDLEVTGAAADGEVEDYAINIQDVAVVNGSFEDISGETQVNEFTFGPLNGWDLYDPGTVTDGGDGPDYYIGTLMPSEHFSQPA